MKHTSTAACLALIAGTATSIMAVQSVSAQQPDDRFVIQKEGENYLRIDRKTGETAFCRIINNSPVCKLSVEERSALSEEIANLQDEISALREKLAANKENGGAERNDEFAKRDDKPIPDPSEELDEEALDRELDRAVEFTKKTVRRFFDVVKELKQEFDENDKL